MRGPAVGPAALEFHMCSTVGCGKPIHARGLCHNCYMKQRRAGLMDSPDDEIEGPVVRIRFYASEALERGLKRLARATGEPRSRILRALVESALKEKGVL